jgi:SNF2 family DNA or RNA helicase
MQYIDLMPGTSVKGLDYNNAVKIVYVEHHHIGSTEYANITYKRPDGSTLTVVLYPEQLRNLTIIEREPRLKLRADGDISKLLIEAQRIKWAHLFDPYLAMHTSDVEPLPHQIEAVYGELLKRQPLRFLLADDPGAGKTIMTGLFIKELEIRGDLEKCLIVCPGSLCMQWQDELYQRFNLRFHIINNQALEESVTGNAFKDKSLCIISLDKLVRDEDAQQKLSGVDWDLIVCDEAHKMSAHQYGKKVSVTKRYQLGEKLSDLTRHFLLLTATPHNGIETDFQLFMRLLDKDQFDRNPNKENMNHDYRMLMRRMVKEDLLRFDGNKLFPERVAETKPFQLSPAERLLYEHVTNYVRNQFNLAENLTKQRKGNVGFALTILQRRLASSPMAIYKSLLRRREHLEKQLEEAINNKNTICGFDSRAVEYDDFYDFLSELPEGEQEATEDEIVDSSTAAQNIEELEKEIEILKSLEQESYEVLRSDCDQKWKELSELLQSDAMYDENGEYRKIIIFSEHKDTVDYLYNRITRLFGSKDAVAVITGGMKREVRRAVEASFTHNKDVKVLVATDAAGEGINLQRAHLMVNYDLPWNPNRIEQRFGRIHRIGQQRKCRLWNMLADDTRESAVFIRLFEKIMQEQASLGGSVFDVLGKIRFSDKDGEDISLEALLKEAIRSDGDTSTYEDIGRRIDSALDTERLRQLIEEDMLAKNTMDVSQVMEVKRQMEIAETRKLQPHYIYQFFSAAFKLLGGRMIKKSEGRYQITFVPQTLLKRAKEITYGMTVPHKYECVCFDKKYVHIEGQPNALLLHPGNILMQSIIDELQQRYKDNLEQCTLLIDRTGQDDKVRMLYYILSDINDATTNNHGHPRLASRRLAFIEMYEDGTAVNSGIAPYLDYEPATEKEYSWVKRNLPNLWTVDDDEKKIEEYATTKLVPLHLDEVSHIRNEIVNKTKAAVENRLKREIRRQDTILAKAREDKRAGVKGAEGRISQAQNRIEELSIRLKYRLEELSRQKALFPLPPSILGRALIIPESVFNVFTSSDKSSDSQARKEMEKAGMLAVLQIEKHLGFVPEDVSAEKLGYDVRSCSEKSGNVRFIEVKARIADADYITITPNEHITALNKPDSFYLAIVMVEDGGCDVIYLKEPFDNNLDETVKSVNFKIENLINKASSKQKWRVLEHGIQEKAD